MDNNDIQIRIDTAIQTAEAAQGLKDLKKSIRELQGLAIEFGDASPEIFNKVTTAAGQLKDKIGDTRASIAAVSGEPIENLGGAFNLVRNNLSTLDFGQVAKGIKLFNDNLKNVKPADLAKSLKEVTGSLLELGKTLLTNPIFLLGALIVLIVTHFNDLKEAGGAVGKIFTAIGDTIKLITDAIIAFTDAIGLTSVASQKKTEKILADLEKEKEAITERYDLETKLATDNLKSTALVEARKINAIQENAKQVIQVYEGIKAANGKLTDAQKVEYEKSLAAFKKSEEDKLEFQTRIAKIVIDSERDNNFQIEQNRINVLNDSHNKIAAQEDLNRKKAIVEENKSYDKQTTDLQSFYTSRLKNIDANSATAISLTAQAQTQLTKLETEHNQKISDLGSIAAKKIHDDTLARRTQLLSDQQKLLQTYLSLELNDYTKSEKEKLAYQLENITKQEKLSKESFEIELQKANGNATKQKSLIAQQLADQKTFEQNKAVLIKQSADKETQKILEIKAARLDANIFDAQNQKELARSYQAQLDAELVLLSANTAKELFEYKRTYDEKIKVVGLSEGQIKAIKDDYSNKTSKAQQLENIRAAKLQKDFDDSQKDLILQNRIDTNETELALIDKKATLSLRKELDLIKSINTQKLQELQNAKEKEIELAQGKADQIDAINKKYAAKELQQLADSQDKKLQAITNTANKVINVGKYVLDVGQSLSDYADQQDQNRLKKGEKLSIDTQKKEFTRHKALSIGSAIINTAQAVTSALATPPFPLGVVLASLAGISGALQIAKIASTKFNPDDSSSGGGSSPSISAPSTGDAPTLANNSPFRTNGGSQFSTNKINSIGNGSNTNPTYQPPQRVYVLENDITSMQSKVAVTQQRASLSRP